MQMTPEQRASYLADGYVRIPNAISPALMAELNAVVDSRLANEVGDGQDFVAGLGKYQFAGGCLQPGVHRTETARNNKAEPSPWSNDRPIRYSAPPGWEAQCDPPRAQSHPAFRALIEPPVSPPPATLPFRPQYPATVPAADVAPGAGRRAGAGRAAERAALRAHQP